MAALMATVTIMTILSLAGYQSWEAMMRREREAEMMFRAQDLVRAIQRYRDDHGGIAPLQLKDLMEPGTKGQYHARKLWKDPLVKGGKWGLLHIGPDGQVLDPSVTPQAGQVSGLGGGLGLKQSKTPGLGFGSTSNSGNDGQPGGVPGGGLGGGIGGPPPGSLSGGAEATGLPIAGVKSLCTEKAFREWKGLTEYREWLFTYLDLEMAQAQAQAPPGTGPPGGGGGGSSNPGGIGGGNPPGGGPGGKGGDKKDGGSSGAKKPKFKFNGTNFGKR